MFQERLWTLWGKVTFVPDAVKDVDDSSVQGSVLPWHGWGWLVSTSSLVIPTRRGRWNVTIFPLPIRVFVVIMIEDLSSLIILVSEVICHVKALHQGKVAILLFVQLLKKGWVDVESLLKSHGSESVVRLSPSANSSWNHFKEALRLSSLFRAAMLNIALWHF